MCVNLCLETPHGCLMLAVVESGEFGGRFARCARRLQVINIVVKTISRQTKAEQCVSGHTTISYKGLPVTVLIQLSSSTIHSFGFRISVKKQLHHVSTIKCIQHI